jgi:membrane associated rhomboid family serine protease
MLLIPVGQDDNVVRRTPWVSAVLIAVNVLVFVAMLTVDSGEQAIEDSLSAFAEYLGEHPYLTIDPEMSRRLGSDFQELHARAYNEHWQRGLRIEDERLAAEQQHLDGLVAAVQAALRDRPVERLGYIPATPDPLDAVTSMFMHADWGHLLGNMWFLFLSGPFVEDRFGRLVFALLYSLAGMAALGAHVAHAPDSLVPLVGASGAIAGVMGAFLVRLARTRIHFLIVPIPILWMLRFRVRWPAYVVLPLWFGEQYLYARLSSGSGVAFWAHVGGFAFGVAAALAIKLSRVEENLIHGAIERRIGVEQDPALEAALSARLAGDYATATRTLRGLLARQPDNVDGWAECYELGLASGDGDGTGRALARLMALYQRLGETQLLHELVGDRRWRDADLPPAALLAPAAQLERLGDVHGALALYDDVSVRAPQDPSSLRALMRRGALLRQAGDEARARQAYERALRHPACDATWRATIERALEAGARGREPSV